MPAFQPELRSGSAACSLLDDDDDIFVYLSSRKTHRFTTYIHKGYYKEKKGIMLVFKIWVNVVA